MYSNLDGEMLACPQGTHLMLLTAVQGAAQGVYVFAQKHKKLERTLAMNHFFKDLENSL